eukprot:m.157537 g.157537  ORF g.157537 m.157537 type:complete len:51 (+) comp38710_c0_seq14:599-751(+)
MFEMNDNFGHVLYWKLLLFHRNQTYIELLLFKQRTTIKENNSKGSIARAL